MSGLSWIRVQQSVNLQQELGSKADNSNAVDPHQSMLDFEATRKSQESSLKCSFSSTLTATSSKSRKKRSICDLLNGYEDDRFACGDACFLQNEFDIRYLSANVFSCMFMSSSFSLHFSLM